MRKIIHIDMDAFFASVAQLDNPELIGKPVAVGGNEDRGVISAASYEARKFGVKSAMSSKIAARMCPDLIFVPHSFQRYKEISLKMREIFYRYTDLVEPLSFDEAFLDVTSNKLNIPSATFIAQSIRNDIRNELGLTASAGVSYNKFLAKIASDQDKPDGLFLITEENVQQVLDNLSVGRFFGVGKVMEERLHELHIRKGKDLRGFSIKELQQYFGRSAQYLYEICRGIDERSVNPDGERKSMAIESTFDHDIFDTTGFQMEAERILTGLWERYQRYEKKGRSLTLKVKYNDFSVKNKSRTQMESIESFSELEVMARPLIDGFLPLENPVRLIGFQISGFNREEQTQMKLEI
jgi:DNA polymerase IV